MRQYAGFASAEETNERYRYLLERGQTGLSVAFDLPTQLGYDSDDPRALGEVGRTGVAIDSLADMELLFDGIPLDEVSTSMTINAPAALLLLLYELVAEEQGVAGDAAPRHGPERHPQGVHRPRELHLPAAAVDAAHDRPVRVLRGAAAALEHDLDLRLPHPRGRLDGGAGARVHARERHRLLRRPPSTRACRRTSSARGSRSSSTRTTTSSRRWRSSARRGGCGRGSCASASARRTRRRSRCASTRRPGGSTLTAQQPENNVVRVAIQALSAVCGGAQSLHTNGFDEALALPTERSARIALRTQQILAHEAGGTDTADPLGGAYFIEALTDELEERALGADRARSTSSAARSRRSSRASSRREIEEAAFRYQQEVEAGERVIVGVNRYAEAEEEQIELHRLDPEAERRQLERTARVRAERDAAAAAGGAGRGAARRASGDGEPAPADARGAPRPLHGRRDLRRPPRGVGHVRRASAAEPPTPPLLSGPGHPLTHHPDAILIRNL